MATLILHALKKDNANLDEHSEEYLVALSAGHRACCTCARGSPCPVEPCGAQLHAAREVPEGPMWS